MEWTFIDYWIVATGIFSAMACALLGNFLVLRRMSMMGDAISHAVLPGLAIAFLITGSRDSVTMLVGAVLIGIVAAFLIQGVTKLGGLDKGASMGVIFTTLFALGLILIRQAADHVDLDPGCVLYGAIELTPLDVYEIAGWEVPRAAATNGAMLLVNLVFVGSLYKELKITSFDPDLATTMGINAGFMHYLLMSLVAATTIAAFESVGSILVIAMLIVPGACAHLLTDRLPVMIALSLLIAAMSAVLGHWGAISLPPLIGFRDTGTAGMMATAAGFIFALVFLFAPRHGVAGRWLGQALLALRIDRDDILGFLYRHRELAPEGAPPVRRKDLAKALLSGTRARIASWDLARRGLVQTRENGVRLTSEGLAAAKNLVRSHRLWEAYLCEQMGFCETDVHYTAHRLEHFTDADMQSKLHEAAGKPQHDPHRREIPD